MIRAALLHFRPIAAGRPRPVLLGRIPRSGRSDETQQNLRNHGTDADKAGIHLLQDRDRLDGLLQLYHIKQANG
jgi:hypothetical protein